MHLETGLLPVLALKAACVGKNAQFCYFKKNMQVKGLNFALHTYISRLTVVSHEAKEEVPCDGLSTNVREYFTRTNLVKIKNAITNKPLTFALHYFR